MGLRARSGFGDGGAGGVWGKERKRPGGEAGGPVGAVTAPAAEDRAGHRHRFRHSAHQQRRPPILRLRRLLHLQLLMPWLQQNRRRQQQRRSRRQGERSRTKTPTLRLQSLRTAFRHELERVEDGGRLRRRCRRRRRFNHPSHHRHEIAVRRRVRRRKASGGDGGGG